MQFNAPFLKCKDAVKRGLLPAGTHCPKCPKKAGDCLFKMGLWRPDLGSGCVSVAGPSAVNEPQLEGAGNADAPSLAPARKKSRPHRFGTEEHVEQFAPSHQDRRLSSQSNAAAASSSQSTAPSQAEAELFDAPESLPIVGAKELLVRMPEPQTQLLRATMNIVDLTCIPVSVCSMAMLQN